MVELQSCGSLMNASALCGIEQEVVKGESSASHFAIAEILAELQRERQKNAELRDRISILEAQIQDKGLLHSNGQGSFPSARERSFKKFKKQKVEEQSNETIENGSIPMAPQTRCMPLQNLSLNRLVNWMSMDDNHFFREKLNEGDSAANCADTDDTDDEGDENEENAQVANDLDELLEDADKGMIVSFVQSSSGGQGKATFLYMSQESSEDQTKIGLLPDINPLDMDKELKHVDRKQMESIGGCQVPLNNFISDQDFRVSGSILTQKKPQKMAFCPKEVKRIIELEELLLKNAQSHTIRKIIVFASLGIRHGCEDMYELDYNHFSILRKGEPYVSLNNPGEHVLYENPAIRRKVFYPNRQNPILCPVQILEEEKAMRPFDAGCPSCLFLCIKYGGRTRNLPQNEYVRQRMGRNKLKSFGPVICRMAMLVHIRSGSFFFKALGITLLFMAGFPDDLVQKETKYRNLDLLQKYYRTDEDAEGEELFLLCPITCNSVRTIPRSLIQAASPNSEHLLGKTNFTKSKGKKYTISVIKSQNSEKAAILQSAPSSSAPPTQFGLMGYTSIQTNAMIQTTPSRTLADTPPISYPMISSSGPKISHPNQYSYPILPPYPSSSFVPMMYWPPPNVFPPCPYPSSYGYRPFPASGSYMSIHPQPYYSHSPCSPMNSKLVEGTKKNNAASTETDNDSNSSSSSTAEPKEE